MPDRVSRETIVGEARRWLGTPYHHQESVIGIGCDCIGLVRGVYRVFVGPEPENRPNYSTDWGDVNGAETMLEYFERYLHKIHGFDNNFPGSANIKREIADTPGVVIAMRWKPRLVAKHCFISSGNGHAIHAINNNPVAEIPFTDWWLDKCVAAFDFPGAV